MNNLRLFFEAIDNYDLYNESKLIKYAVKICILDEDIEEYYKKFMNKIIEYELDGTMDIIDPIINEYNTKIQ